MRVAYLIDNLGSGGAQRQAVEIAARLSRVDGVDVHFAIYRPGGFFDARLREAEIPLTCIPKRGPIDPLFPGRLRRWIRATRPTVLHAFLPMPVLWTAVACTTGRGPWPFWIGAERSSPIDNTRRLGPVTRWAYARADAVTANSIRAAEALVEAWGLPVEHVHYLPNGIDLAAWDARATGPAPFPIDPSDLNLALVGRFSAEKNHVVFLDALMRLPPALRARVRVFLIGAPDSESEAVAARIQAHGLGGRVTCHPPTADLPALLARLDGLVLPSRYEGSPNVVLEALASRLPVVASDVGDVPSLVSPESGFRVPPGDVDALAGALERLLGATGEARAAMGAAARATVEASFAIDHVAQMHLDLYRRLTDSVPGDLG